MKKIHEMTPELQALLTTASKRLESAVAALPTKVAWPEGIEFTEYLGRQAGYGTPRGFGPVLFTGQTDASGIGVSRWSTVLGEDGHVYAVGSLELDLEDSDLSLRAHTRELADVGVTDLGEVIAVGRMVPRSVLEHVVDYGDNPYSSGPCVRWGTRDEAKAVQQALIAELTASLADLG